MTIVKHELRLGRTALLIWTVAIALMLALCVMIYPEMSKQMDGISEAFANMGSFSAAFGMDQVNFGELIGFFGVECGNILGIGGALFSALIGISALAKEEKEHTADFLLAHPLSRTRIVAEKLCAIVIEIVILNLIVQVVTGVSILMIGEEIDVETIALLFTAYVLMQFEVAAITFGLSAFLRRGTLGLGLGLAAVFYFVNIISNLTDDLKFLKYITPFGYTDGADIISDKAINGGYLAVGAVMTAAGIGLAFWKYGKKDIA